MTPELPGAGSATDDSVPEARAETDDVGAEDAAAPVRPRPETVTLRQRLGRLWRAGDRNPQIRWLKKIVTFPIGERFAVISITAALFEARTVFIVMLACGGFAYAYVLLGRILRSLAS